MVVATFRHPGSGKSHWGFYAEFRQEWEHLFNIPGVKLPTGHQPAHIFACYYQVVRAFHHIFEQIIGSSLPAARLRAAVWQSVFTHDIRRYRRSLFARMSEFATLITGHREPAKNWWRARLPCHATCRSTRPRCRFRKT